MSKRKYVVKSIKDIDPIRNNFKNTFIDRLSNDDFDKAFNLFIHKYDEWIYTNGFIVWKKLVDKIKIVDFELVATAFFTRAYNNAAFKLFWVYKFYRLKVDTAKTVKQKKNINDEFNRKVIQNIHLYNDFDLVADLIGFDLATDLKGNIKGLQGNKILDSERQQKSKFIFAITGVEYIFSHLQTVIKKVTTKMMIEYCLQERYFKDKKIIDYGPKFYNDYKSRNKKDWSNTYDLYKIDKSFNESILDLIDNFYRFIEKKYPAYLIKLTNKDNSKKTTFKKKASKK